MKNVTAEMKERWQIMDEDDFEPDAYERTGERMDCSCCGGTGVEYDETCLICGGKGWIRSI